MGEISRRGSVPAAQRLSGSRAVARRAASDGYTKPAGAPLWLVRLGSDSGRRLLASAHYVGLGRVFGVAR
jgi:hypothetical protein